MLRIILCKAVACLVWVLVWKCKTAPGNTVSQDSPDSFTLKYAWVFCVGFLWSRAILYLVSFIVFQSIVAYLKWVSRLACFVIFLHVLQNCRCVPQSGFSAHVSIDIVIDSLIGICVDMLIDKEEGGGVKERISSQNLTTPYRRVETNVALGFPPPARLRLQLILVFFGVSMWTTSWTLEK